ncbi:MAG: tetratricopeptide repeat protein [Flavobacteriales bacterium]|nr:tetratricopeptide repeat protein [Flavobacteriales bacterium]
MTWKAWIIGSILLAALLATVALVAPRHLPEDYLLRKEHRQREQALREREKILWEELGPADRIRVRMWDKKLREGQWALADSLASFWMRRGKLLMACKALTLRASLSGLPSHYESAFDFCQAALDMEQEDDRAHVLTTLRQTAEQALSTDSLMPSAQVAMAVVEVHEGGNPMAGIGRLRRLLQREPRNVKALLQMGHFSMLSGQADKALERYLMAIQAAPQNASVAFYVADAYARLGQLDSATSWLARLINLESNPTTRASVIQYFQENHNIRINR